MLTAESPVQSSLSSLQSMQSMQQNRKNKRKSLEPKKLPTSPSSLEKDLSVKRQRLGSTGSDDHGPGSQLSSLSSLSPASTHSRSPSPSSATTTIRAPPKMRFKQEKAMMEAAEMLNQSKRKSPFRPWDVEAAREEKTAAAAAASAAAAISAVPIPPVVPGLSPEVTATLSAMYPGFALAMSAAAAAAAAATSSGSHSMSSAVSTSSSSSSPPPEQDEPLSLVKHERSKQPPRMANSLNSLNTNGVKLTVDNVLKHDPKYVEHPLPASDGGECRKAKQRNYKNMTRERRVEANARERQRVHTITAAFDNLQNAIPTGCEDSGIDNSKLSKLSVIKIATSYIMVLSRAAGYDYSIDQSAPSVDDCVEQCRELIEAETRAKGKRSGDLSAE